MENANMQSYKLIPLTLLIGILIAKPMTAASTAPTPDSFNNKIKYSTRVTSNPTFYHPSGVCGMSPSYSIPCSQFQQPISC